MTTIWQYLPRGNTLDDEAWNRRHRIVLWFLCLHLPALFVFGLALGHPALVCAEVVAVPLLCAALARLTRRRRPASIFATAGLTSCSVALVGFSHGSIEAHFHFFVIIGFIALYQDWAPFLWNITFTVVSHGIGSLLYAHLIFNHHAGQHDPWIWSGIHGLAVAIACTGIVLFWRVSEEDQQRVYLAKRQADVEAGRRRFTSDLLVNLARRNQRLLYRQLEIINQLEEKERDPDALAELFRLDHLATRVRRNAENLLVLSGEATSRVWSTPVPLREVVQAAIAETEDLDRVTFVVDEWLTVAGNSVTDLTHLLAELTENAARFSPPASGVSIAARPYPQTPGATLLTIEDWGVGMPPDAIAAANQVLSHAPEIDLSASRRLGFHVVARLAKRHGIAVSLTPTPGCGVTAAVVLPPELFGSGAGATPSRHGERGPGHALRPAIELATAQGGSRHRQASTLVETVISWPSNDESWDGWWDAVSGPPSNHTAPREVAGTEVVAHEVAVYRGPAPEPVAPEPVAPEPVPPPADGDALAHTAGAHQTEPRLNRRRPQTHLAPELRHAVPRPRVEGEVGPEIPPPAPDALSRYQASRHAAQAVAERRDVDPGQWR